jgi:hypothetical protein
LEDWRQAGDEKSGRRGEAVASLDALGSGKETELMFWQTKEKILLRMKQIAHTVSEGVSFPAVLMRDLDPSFA